MGEELTRDWRALSSGVGIRFDYFEGLSCKGKGVDCILMFDKVEQRNNNKYTLSILNES